MNKNLRIGLEIIGGIAILALLLTRGPGPRTQPKIVFSIANFAQLALLQGEQPVPVPEMMMMRRADGELGTTGYQVKVYSLPGCCPCPNDPSVHTCQCDFAEFYQQYAAKQSWSPDLSMQNLTDSTSKPLIEASREGDLILYKLPELKAGPHLFIINAAFNNKDAKTYKVRVEVDQKGRLSWTDKP